MLEGYHHMNNSGIIAQYGFLYQRKAFILYALENANPKQAFTFEGNDDIEVSPEDSIYALHEHGVNYIQVKSGYVTKSCFSKVICNWLLLDESAHNSFKLFSENDLDFVIDDSVVEYIFQFILAGEKKQKSSIARKAYEKYKTNICSAPTELMQLILNNIDKFNNDVCCMNDLDRRLENIFFHNYCQDIKEYDLAKSKRLERLISYINQEIDLSVKAKTPYILSYSDLIRMIMQICEEISDRKYITSIPELKKKSQNDAARIVAERQAREVKQLYLVDNHDDFVIDGIVHELLYQDFRDVYAAQKKLEIINLEQNAYENFNTAVFSLEKSDAKIPKKVFLKTMEAPLDDDLLPNSLIYRKGCYIYLTGDMIEKEYQITWGDSNE